MSYQYDIVIIGGGNGGLMAACRAASMGMKTLLIEKQNTVGGAASSFRRGRFEFEASLHEVADLGSGASRGLLGHIFDELGVELEVAPINNAYRLIITDGAEKNLDVTVPHGREQFRAFMEEQAPGGGEAADRLFEAVEVVAKGMEYVGMSRGNPDPEVLERDYNSFCRICGVSMLEFLHAIEMPQRCIDIIGAYWPYQGSPLDVIDASRYILMICGFYGSGAYIPKYRSHDLANAVMKRAVELGCDFWLNTEVAKVTTKKGRVSGVVTADGREVSATAVISNAFPETVYGKMLDNKRLVPKFELQKINARSYGFRGFSVYLGLDASPEELGIRDYEVFINSSADTSALFGRSDRGIGDNLDATCLNIAIPDASPAGTSMLVFTTGYTREAWGDVTLEEYAREKSRCAGIFIDRYSEVMGIDLRSHIEELEVATPVTFARYMSSPQGSIYGYYSDRWDGLSARTLLGRSEPTVPGLFFVGGHASKLAGYFPTLSSGDTTARQALGYVMSGGEA